ncbi:hypothetical protein CAPTEDRAFT_204042 [Capitella teleta]|uniref:C2H2-type domain-containing protein n=1 Tax=Capitella teleta TaxID=283909 RepID=R7TLM0_CAPTE|nr:hypothetical protein CAPTEDRAFT_204042 [Capitella teleta]|eukprot:ELT94397.1 hypothetical protein CAPTEDRAFT_204042 [Capitella teleta]
MTVDEFRPRYSCEVGGFNRCVDKINSIDLSDYIKLKRPTTQWSVVAITNITLRNYVIGNDVSLPQYYKVGECKNKKRVEREALKLFKQAKPGTRVETYNGGNFDELTDLAKLFKTNIIVYRLKLSRDAESRTAEFVYRTCTTFAASMHLDLYKDRHFSLISNIASYTQTYRCIRCGEYFKTHKQVNRHLRTCGSAVRLIYPGGVYSEAKSIFEEVKEYLGMEFSKEDSVYPYRNTYDFECMFKYNDVPLRSENTEWAAKHIPMSVSLCSNVESFTEPKCFLSERHDTDATALIHSMIKYMLDIQEEASRLLHEKYSAVLIIIYLLLQTYESRNSERIKLFKRDVQ